MNFLNPTVLFASLAALVPLIIHLFSRRRVKVVEFSSLKHLKAMQRRQVRRIKIRQLLLLLLRMLIILAVVVAFSRPTTEGGNIGSHASVSAVILVDNSASMNRCVADGNLFDIARKRTEELLGTFGESDQVCLLELDPTGSTDITPAFASPAAALDKLQLVRQGTAGADFAAGMDNAADLLESAVNVNKELYIVTDRQRRSLPSEPTARPIDARVLFVDLPDEDQENCGVTGVTLGGRMLLPGQDFELTATVRNYAAAERADMIASLSIDGARVAQIDFSAAADQETTVRFSRSVSQGGFHSGFVEISDDHYPGDNRYYFSFHIPDVFNVLVIGDDAAARLTAMALNPSPEINQYWSVKTVSSAGLGSVNLWDYEVVILSGAPTLPDAYYQRLQLLIGQGKSLMVTYGPDTDTDKFNTYLTGMTGVILEQAMKREVSRTGYYTLESVDTRHPIFSVFPLKDGAPPEIRFFTLPRYRLAATAVSLATFSGGHPALVENTYAEGRVATFLGPIAPEYSDLAGHAFFVPLMARTAEYLASDLSSFDLGLFCGEPLSRTVTLRGALGGALQMSAPDSSFYELDPQERQGALVIEPSPTDLPGVYRVTYQGREVDRFAQNIDPAEGNLAAADNGQLAAALAISDFAVLEAGSPMAASVAELRFGKELWQVFLWLAVILLAVEMLLSRGAPSEE